MADTFPPAGPSDRAGRAAPNSGRELREFVPLVENPRPYQPNPLPNGHNPYLTLRHVLRELFWQAACARDGQDVCHHINPTTGPWDDAEARARGCSAGWGIPFTVFDPILSDAKRTLRELSQVAAGNSSVPFSATDSRYPLLEERLEELANSVPVAGGGAAPVDVAPAAAGDFIELMDQPPLAHPSRVSEIPVDPPPGLDSELATAYRAVVVGIRECTRLVASIPYLWENEGEYRRLAACVADAATAARAAYMAVDIRLRRAGGPNLMLDALNDVLTVQGRAPLDPTATPGGLNAILTNLYTRRAELLPRVEGRMCIDRMLDQLARVPPATYTGPADPPPAAGTQQGEGGEPAAGSPPGWAELGDAKRAILMVLNKSIEGMQGMGIAKEAGYKYGTLRHHFGELQTWKYIDKSKDGYTITPSGAALVPCERV